MNYELIGRVIMWFLGAGVGCFFFFLAAVIFDAHILRPRREKEWKLGYQEATSQFSRNSYWFSEHPPTVWLLDKLTRENVEGMGSGIEAVRSEWRVKMEKETSRG